MSRNGNSSGLDIVEDPAGIIAAYDKPAMIAASKKGASLLLRELRIMPERPYFVDGKRVKTIGEHVGLWTAAAKLFTDRLTEQTGTITRLPEPSDYFLYGIPLTARDDGAGLIPAGLRLGVSVENIIGEENFYAGFGLGDIVEAQRSGTPRLLSEMSTFQFKQQAHSGDIVLVDIEPKITGFTWK